jgi:hypothetical protein
MQGLSGTLFFVGTFIGAFAFGFPVGPSSLEMLRLQALDRHRQAWSLAAGVAFADAAWALAAFAGMHPWLEIAHLRRQGLFFFVTALVCALLAWRDRIEASRRGSGRDPDGRRSHFWLGALLGASYPLTLASWIAALAVLRGFGWVVPAGPAWLALFFVVVFLGYFSYLALLRLLFVRLHGRLLFSQENRLSWLPRVLLLGLALVFLGLAAAEFWRKP